ncbi:MAG: hydroxyacid dehydrogenase [Opitutus sp.]|nr:hydroxyacid dehydrogenase [Opitutus sp.]
MPDSRPIIWTDSDLQADAKALLLSHTSLDCLPRGDPMAGLESADGAIVSAVFPGVAATFARAARLKVVARVGIGYDNINVDEASAAGVCAVNTPDAPTESTAEFAVGLMFSLMRKIPLADRRLKIAGWKLEPALQGTDFVGKTLGIVGFGRIGRRVAEIVGGLKMRVLASDPYIPVAEITSRGVEPVADLHALLAQADIVTIHVPLSPLTRHLIDAKALAAIPHGGILINSARGGLVDPVALLEVLRSGHLAGAGLDVWPTEPTEPSNPLLTLDNVVATPHMAAYTQEGRRRSHVAAVQQVLMVLRGERPPSLLNPEIWDRRRLR